MLKKTTLAIAAAAAITMAALAPSTASAKTSFHIGFYGAGYGYSTPFYGHRYSYRPHRRCHFHKRKVWSYGHWRWKRVRHCRSHYSHYNSYY